MYVQICIMEAIVFDLCDRMEWGGIWLTTLVPVVIMLVVNYGVLRHKLKLSPLNSCAGICREESRRGQFI